jgi:hypothetical protein
MTRREEIERDLVVVLERIRAREGRVPFTQETLDALGDVLKRHTGGSRRPRAPSDVS